MPPEIVRNARMSVDAIVNADNTTLLGGVDGAIHRAAGPQLLEACRTPYGCRTGEAKIARGYRLPCRCVIHAADPAWQDGHHGGRELLTACYQSSLELADSFARMLIRKIDEKHMTSRLAADLSPGKRPQASLFLID